MAEYFKWSGEVEYKGMIFLVDVEMKESGYYVPATREHPAEYPDYDIVEVYDIKLIDHEVVEDVEEEIERRLREFEKLPKEFSFEMWLDGFHLDVFVFDIERLENGEFYFDYKIKLLGFDEKKIPGSFWISFWDSFSESFWRP